MDTANRDPIYAGVPRTRCAPRLFDVPDPDMRDVARAQVENLDGQYLPPQSRAYILRALEKAPRGSRGHAVSH